MNQSNTYNDENDCDKTTIRRTDSNINKRRLSIATAITANQTTIIKPSFEPTKSPQMYHKCGNKFCGFDDYCCNRSCGICAKNGQSCDKNKCTDPAINIPLSCKNDSDCPSPICTNNSNTQLRQGVLQLPIDFNNTFSDCPIGKCKNNTCALGKRKTQPFMSPTSEPQKQPQPTQHPIGSNKMMCTTVLECPTPTCLQSIANCPIPKCANNQCILEKRDDIVVVSRLPKTEAIPVQSKVPVSVHVVPIAPISALIINPILVSVPASSPSVHGNQQQLSPKICIHDDQCTNPQCPPNILHTMPSFCPQNKCIDKTCQVEMPPSTIVCGTVICSENEYCCNESCGICVKMQLPLLRQGQLQQQQQKCDSTKVCSTKTAIQCRDDLDCDYDKTCDVISGDCVQSVIHCGQNQCIGGDICCNFDCGICSPPGTQCSQHC
jgi:hypothetical protein